MSMFRSFSPKRSSSPHKHHNNEVSLRVHVPAYGVLYLKRPEVAPFPPGDHDGDGTDVMAPPPVGEPNELRGEVDIVIPEGFGPRRAKSLTVGFKSECTLDVGPSRMAESDVFYDWHTTMDGDGEGIFLGEGHQRFEIDIMLAANHPAHDWHPGAKIKHTLYAELEGVEPCHHNNHHSSLIHFPWRSSAKSAKGKEAVRTPNGLPVPGGRSSSPRPHGENGERSSSPRPGFSPRASAHELVRNSSPRGSSSALNEYFSMIDVKDALPEVPPYSPTNEVETPAASSIHGDGSPPCCTPADNSEVAWLEGSFKAVRNIKLCYNPDPDGGVSDLDSRIAETVPGLASYELILFSSVWTVGARLRARFRAWDISPKVTIFHYRVALHQTIHLYSPRDKPKDDSPGIAACREPSATRTRIFSLIEAGESVPGGLAHPKSSTPALWRGTEAKGHDTEPLVLVGKGRLPNDRSGRPSTLPGVDTPLKVVHELVTCLYFAVYGEDAFGNPLPKHGSGAKRVLIIKKPVVIPPCPIIPQQLALPPYDQHPGSDLPSLSKPCPICHTPIENKLCTACPRDKDPHPRHDHPPKLVGNPEGICPLCSVDVMPSGEVGWRNCGCGLTDEQLDTMEKSSAWAAGGGWDVTAGTSSRNGLEVGAPPPVHHEKYEFERGRGRRM